MEIAEDIIHKYVRQGRIEGLPRCERNEMLDRFLARLNPDRADKGYKPYTYPQLATLLAKVPTSDLHAFYVKCEQAKSFGAMFHWSLKHQDS